MVIALLAAGVHASTAAAAGWSAPLVLSPAGENAIETQVAMNSHGDAAVVWKHRIDPWHSSIEVSSRSGYGPFTAPAVITSWQIVDPRVTIDGQGNAVVVWAEDEHPGEPVGDLVRASFGHAGGMFGAPVTLWKDNGNSGSHNICLGTDAHGTTTAFWTQEDGALLHYATRPAGGSFSAPATIPNAGDGVWWPSCVVSANGDTFVAWIDGLRVQEATRRAGAASFTAKVLRPLDPDRPLVSNAAVAADAHGNAVVTWSEATDQSNREIWGKASLRPAGGDFGAPERIAHSNGGLLPLIGPSGRTEAFGFAGSQLDQPVGEGEGSLTRSAGGSWGGYEQWTPHGFDDTPATAFDDAGNLFVAARFYYDRESPHGHALATIRPAGGRFPDQETQISADGHNIWQVALAAGAAGHAIAVWPRGEVDSFRIELAEYGGTPALAGGGSGDPGSGDPASGGSGDPGSGGSGDPAPGGSGDPGSGGSADPASGTGGSGDAASGSTGDPASGSSTDPATAGSGAAPHMSSATTSQPARTARHHHGARCRRARHHRPGKHRRHGCPRPRHHPVKRP